MSTGDAFNALVMALTAYAGTVPENSKREVGFTDLIQDSKVLESLLSLHSAELGIAALQAAQNVQDELKDTKPCSTFEITFQNPGRYTVVHSTLPLQR